MKDDERIVQLRSVQPDGPDNDPIPEISLVTAIEHAEIVFKDPGDACRFRELIGEWEDGQ